MHKLVLATNNKNKVREITDLLSLHGLGHLEILLIGQYTSVEPDETGSTYLDNATIKAQAAATLTGLPCLAEDSGVEITALDGKPGVDTAPWIAAQGGWETAMKLVAGEVDKTGNPTMYFHSTFVLALPDGTLLTSTAMCPGTFTYPPRGTEGFGHDPYFIPTPVEGFNYFIPYGENRTYAEIGMAEKQKISPRALSLIHLIEQIKENDRPDSQPTHKSSRHA